LHSVCCWQLGRCDRLHARQGVGSRASLEAAARERDICIHQRAGEGGEIDRGYLGRILLLTLLAPDIVEAILDGRQPTGLGLPTLMKPFPMIWSEQRLVLAPGQCAFERGKKSGIWRGQQL
jgi:hypothetical protein